MRFFPARSWEPVGLRREESLFVSFFPLIFALVWVFSLHLCLASLFNPTKRGASVEFMRWPFGFWNGRRMNSTDRRAAPC